MSLKCITSKNYSTRMRPSYRVAPYKGPPHDFISLGAPKGHNPALTTIMFIQHDTCLNRALSKQELHRQKFYIVAAVSNLGQSFLNNNCSCPATRFPMSYVMVFFVFNDLRSEVIVRFVDIAIGRIVDHHF